MNISRKYQDGVLVEFSVDGISQLDGSIIEQPKPDWPILLRPMKLLAQPKDKGLGDIVERVIGPVGGDAYKLWYKATFGYSCPGCNKRKNDLNLRFPIAT